MTPLNAIIEEEKIRDIVTEYGDTERVRGEGRFKGYVIRDGGHVMSTQITTDRILKIFTTAIQRAYEAGIEEAVEVIKKINWRNGGLGNTPYDSQIIDYYEKTLDDTIKALQDKKVRVWEP